MKPLDEWKIQFQQEIQKAERARVNGNEGMARVCARRAAGIVIEEYWKRHGCSFVTNSYQSLEILSNSNDVSSKAREVARHLLLRVTTDFNLPIEADLIAETHWLADELLPE